jgi:hypothetical protein
VLQNGVGVTKSGAKGSQTFYSLDVPAGASGLKFVLSGGTGDADLYTKFGAQPTTTSFECRPFLNGNNETCNIANAQAGKYFALVVGFAAYTNAKITGSFTGGGGGGSCSHSPCVTGAALVSGCEPAVTAVCAADSFCCNSSWDSICVGETTSIGGKACP